MAPHQLQAYLFLTNGVLKFTAGDWWFAIFFTGLQLTTNHSDVQQAND